MWSCDPRRFTAFAAEPDYCVAKGMEVYGHEYAMHFPHHAWPAGRGPEALAGARPDRGARGAVRRRQRLGARQLVRQARRRRLRGRHPDLGAATGPWFAAGPRGMPGGARRRRHPRPAGLLALPAARARARRRGWRRRSPAGCRGPGGSASATSPTTAGGSSPRCRSWRSAPDDFLLDHRRGGAGPRPRLAASATSPPGLRLEDATDAWSCQILTGPREPRHPRRASATPTSPCPGSATRRPASPAGAAGWRGSPSRASSAGRSTRGSRTRPRSSTR